jgi:hypothetical protein
MNLNLHIVRRWQCAAAAPSPSAPRELPRPSLTARACLRRYYAWKVAMPVLICTVFSFASFFYPIDAEPVEGLFSSSVDKETLDMRNQIAATMILASSALLFVVATLLPKTSYLTIIDKFVLGNLGVQFSVAAISWWTCGVFFPMDKSVWWKDPHIG